MANPYIGLVNRQLAFTRYQLNSRLEETNAAERLRNQGALYAGVWHLSLAYKNYLAEVGANYKLTKPEASQKATDLCQALESMNKSPAEAKELERLEQEGFIAEVFKALMQIERIAPDMVAPAPADIEERDPLKMVDVSGETEEFTFGFESLAQWAQKFKSLIERHREQMIEY
tara:strand:- start:675 stop:1193 length:519 start_codon:yes stop_codon:yes gene_type:complete